jgi:AcrR family transcriptional regulator
VAAVAAVFDGARARHADPLAALEAALCAMAEPVRTPIAMANHLAVLQMDLRDPEFRQHAVAHGRALRRAVERLLAEAMETGRLPDGDPAALAAALQVAFNGALVTWAIHGEGSLRQAVRGVLPIVLGGAAPARVARRGRAPGARPGGAA